MPQAAHQEHPHAPSPGAVRLQCWFFQAAEQTWRNVGVLSRFFVAVPRLDACHAPNRHLDLFDEQLSNRGTSTCVQRVGSTQASRPNGCMDQIRSYCTVVRKTDIAVEQRAPSQTDCVVLGPPEKQRHALKWDR